MSIEQKIRYLIEEGYKILVEDVSDETCITAFVDSGSGKLGHDIDKGVRCYGDSFLQTLNEVVKRVDRA